MKKQWSGNRLRMRKASFITVAFLLLLVSASCLSPKQSSDGGTSEPNVQKSPVATKVSQNGTTFQPPQTGWIAGAQVVVRTWPRESYPPVAVLIRGQEVHITEAARNGLWIHIDQPIEGWVPIEQLRFEEKGRALLLTPTAFRMYLWVKAKPRLRVRALPNTDSEIITHVMYGEMVEIDNLTSDKQWAHIIAPAEGWVNTRYLSDKPIKQSEK